jgi:outer membrane cobalamin receptor
MYSGQGNFKIHYHSFNFNYNITYTGYRYTSSDNSAFLLPFWLSNVWLAKAFSIKKYKLEISSRVNNIFNESYQVMLNRPMPLRNYQIGIRIDFN